MAQFKQGMDSIFFILQKRLREKKKQKVLNFKTSPFRQLTIPTSLLKRNRSENPQLKEALERLSPLIKQLVRPHVLLPGRVGKYI